MKSWKQNALKICILTFVNNQLTFFYYVHQVRCFCVQMTMLLQFTVRQVAETEARFTSVERISYYIQSVPSEAALEIPEKKPPSNWPSAGAIQLSGIKVILICMQFLNTPVKRQLISSPYAEKVYHAALQII